MKKTTKKVKELSEDTTVANKIAEYVEVKAFEVSKQIDCKHQNQGDGKCFDCRQPII